MAKKEIEKNFQEKSVLENGNFMENLRKNVAKLRTENKWTLRTLAEKADMSEDTLGTFLNGKAKDCNLSTVIKLSKAFNISIDVLVDSGTVDDVTKESMSICRNLPENALYLIRWYIRYIESLNKQNEPNKRYVSVMELECTQNGNMKLTTNYTHVDITHINEEYRYKVFFGIKIPCEHYMPLYSPYDRLLIANDRYPSANEHCLVRIKNCLYLLKRKIDNGVVKYYSIRDDKFRFTENEIGEIVGYVVGFLNPDGSWGIR